MRPTRWFAGGQPVIEDLFLHHLQLHAILLVVLVLLNQRLVSRLDLLVGSVVDNAKDTVGVLVTPRHLPLGLGLLLAEAREVDHVELDAGTLAPVGDKEER